MSQRLSVAADLIPKLAMLTLSVHYKSVSEINLKNASVL